MMKKQSSVTFSDMFDKTGYIQVWWNDRLVYDDIDSDGTIEDLRKFQVEFNNKIIYSAQVHIVQFHHCILSIEGEA